MIKFIKMLLTLAVLAVFFILAYNFVAGNEEEKAQAKAIVGKVANLVGSVVEFMGDETQKLQQGKYHTALDQIQQAIDLAKNNASNLLVNGQQWFDELNELERQKAAIEQQLKLLNDMSAEGAQMRNAPLPGDTVAAKPGPDLAQLEREIQQLANKTQSLVDQMYGQ